MNKLVYYFIFCFILFSCEFSIILHKDIFLAQKYLDERKFASAAAVFEDLLKKTIQPQTKVKVLYQLGEIYYLYLNRPKDAIKNYEQILKVGEAVASGAQIGGYGMNSTGRTTGPHCHAEIIKPDGTKLSFDSKDAINQLIGTLPKNGSLAVA